MLTPTVAPQMPMLHMLQRPAHAPTEHVRKPDGAVKYASHLRSPPVVQVVFRFYQPFFIRGGDDGELKAVVSFFLKKDLGTYYDLGLFEIVRCRHTITNGRQPLIY